MLQTSQSFVLAPCCALETPIDRELSNGPTEGIAGRDVETVMDAGQNPRKPCIR